MSLSSSLFTGTSGLKNMGNAMQVIGNNISNVNTVGFKRGKSTFADTLYESVATQAGTAQMGRGMAVGSVSQNFQQGSFESTGNTTDISIGGEGFFVMRKSGTENMFYTRAGNFHFDKAGQLINPEGYLVQGWGLDDVTGDDVGSIRDIILDAFTSPPQRSSRLTAINNLDADATSRSVVLSNNWDSGADTYMAGTNYEYQSVVKVYDSLGSTHDITIFYDKKSGTEWEYVITCNPEEDERNLVQQTDSKGLLARGNLIFSQSSGDILDLSMDRFTGRIGNFTANGVNTVDNIHYEILSYDGLPDDGYGFLFEFDGSTWEFDDPNNDGTITSAERPTNYGTARIIYSDSTEIHLVLQPTGPTDVDIDLKIRLEQAAVATDSLGFDINDATDLHIQGIEGTRYTGDTANDNTSLEINDPGVMTHDSSGLAVIWNPVQEQWYWANPAIAFASSTAALVTGVTTNDTAAISTTTASYTITNAADLPMWAQNTQLRYDAVAGAWDWNMPVKVDDFANQVYTFVPTNDPILSISDTGSNGARATTSAVILEWTGAVWGDSTGADTFASGGLNFNVLNSVSDNTTVSAYMWGAGGLSSGAAIINYTFGTPITTAANQSITFEVDPAPPREYPNALITTSGASTNGFAIDFDADSSTDLVFVVSASTGATPGANNTLIFDIDPNVAPAEYLGATLDGDETEVIIDLDGSGNDSDNRDIVFSFATPLAFGSNTHPYNDRAVIAFDILGSTAWSPILKADIAQSGYFSFMADFLGGEYGATEQFIQMDFGTIYDGTNFENQSLATTQYSKSSSTVFQNADGYAAGDLQEVDVASDGIMTGVYSNGELIPLFRVGLAKFLNNYGLSNEGGNLFSETRESGTAITNKPGQNGLGTLAPNSLEMSNVDISEEFVAMITTQRGFQANSKTITTTDDMMQTVIQMKR
ncbi:MAG: flagellar hook-basal body complex protein [Desulfobacteraceae bacterium]|nr:flagellar hook-basal body complex protein [Desulfobacteraceae bacterium]